MCRVVHGSVFLFLWGVGPEILFFWLQQFVFSLRYTGRIWHTSGVSHVLVFVLLILSIIFGLVLPLSPSLDVTQIRVT